MTQAPSIGPAGSPEALASDDGKRERSTISFPYGDLHDAVRVAHAVHRRGGRCDIDQLAAELNYSSVENGAFRGQVSTARIFGLITTTRGAMALSPLGARAVDPEQERRARAEAFLSVPLYRAVFDEFRGRTLPPAAGLETVLATKGVAQKQTDKARQAFQRSAEQAGYFERGRDRLIAPSFPDGDGLSDPDRERHDVDGGHGGGGGSANLSATPPQMHPFIRGLVDTLPPAGTPWSDIERDEWLTAAKSIFALIYKPNRLALPAAGETGATS